MVTDVSAILGRGPVPVPVVAPDLSSRFVRLGLGLIGFGVSLALLVDARLGLDPWDVLNQGIANHLGVQIGWVVDAVGAVVLVAWVPLRQRPGWARWPTSSSAA
jgi:uncharacterized membrane protein YczE